MQTRLPLIAVIAIVATALLLSAAMQGASAASKVPLRAAAKAKIDPIIPGNMQTIAVTVKDSAGKPIKDSFVTVKVAYASSKIKKGFSGMTDKNGALLVNWTIAKNSDPGNYSFDVKATKSGYGAASIKSSFKVAR
jgi:phosphatidate phosphatase APP1